MTKTITRINAALRRVNSQYTARFVPAENESVDDDIVVSLAGAPTRWSLQLGAGYVAVNELGEDAPGDIWMQDHGTYRTIEAATRRLCQLLAS